MCRIFLFCLMSFANRFITISSCHFVFLAWEIGCFLLISFLFSFVLTKWRAKRRTCQKGNQWHFEAAAVVSLSQSPSALLLPVAIACCLRAARKLPSQQQAQGEGTGWLWLFGSPQGKTLAVGGSAWPQGAELGQWDEQGAALLFVIHLGCRGGIASEQRCLLQKPELGFWLTVTEMQRYDKPLKIIIIGCFYWVITRPRPKKKPPALIYFLKCCICKGEHDRLLFHFTTLSYHQENHFSWT